MPHYRFLAVLFLALLCMPLANMFVFNKINRPLGGYVVPAPKPDCTVGSVIDRSYQNAFEKYINDNIGFRPFFVRLRNQISFALFDKAHAAGVIRGKENFLYEEGYLHAYNGTDYVGHDSIQRQVGRLRELQDTLAAMGKTLLVCLAPGKGSFYPQYFPDAYIKPSTDSTNYKVFSRLLTEKSVNTIDFNRWMISIRDTCTCMLYPRYGIHWSRYAEILAADSIISRIEELRHADIPNISMGSIERTSRLQYSDYDIASGMNLLFQLPSAPMCYPELHWQAGDSLTRPRVAVIADSFYWGMYNAGISSMSFDQGEFWYYNQQVYPQSFTAETTVAQLDLRQAVAGKDVFVLICTEANLKKFDWGLSHSLLTALRSR